MPGSWGYFSPTLFDGLTLLGSFGLFFTLFLLFVRFLPIIAISEVKSILHKQNHTKANHGGHH